MPESFLNNKAFISDSVETITMSSLRYKKNKKKEVTTATSHKA